MSKLGLLAQAGGREEGRETHTVGMYSPGKAFVVYEMSRHVCEVSRYGRGRGNAVSYFAYSTVAGHDALVDGLASKSEREYSVAVAHL